MTICGEDKKRSGKNLEGTGCTSASAEAGRHRIFILGAEQIGVNGEGVN